MSGTEALLDAELVRRIANLAVSSRRVVDGAWSGSHRSALRGASAVFAEHREYRPGDDPRLLDPRAYARTDRPIVKRFEHESRRTVWLALDRSGSMAFPREEGRAPTRKCVHAALLLAALAYLLVREGDAPGVVEVGRTFALRKGPRGGRHELTRILEALPIEPNVGTPTDLGQSLDGLAERADRRGLIVLASDLLDLDAAALAALPHLVAHGHEVLVFHVLHPRELDLAEEGPIRYVGLEREPELETDASALRASYRDEMRAFLEDRRAQTIDAGAAYVLARTDRPVEDAVSDGLGVLRHGGR